MVRRTVMKEPVHHQRALPRPGWCPDDYEREAGEGVEKLDQPVAAHESRRNPRADTVDGSPFLRLRTLHAAILRAGQVAPRGGYKGTKFRMKYRMRSIDCALLLSRIWGR